MLAPAVCFQASRDEVHDHHSILALIRNGVHGVSSKLLISAFKLEGISFGFAAYKWIGYYLAGSCAATKHALG